MGIEVLGRKQRFSLLLNNIYSIEKNIWIKYQVLLYSICK